MLQMRFHFGILIQLKRWGNCIECICLSLLLVVLVLLVLLRQPTEQHRTHERHQHSVQKPRAQQRARRPQHEERQRLMCHPSGIRTSSTQQLFHLTTAHTNISPLDHRRDPGDAFRLERALLSLCPPAETSRKTHFFIFPNPPGVKRRKGSQRRSVSTGCSPTVT